LTAPAGEKPSALRGGEASRGSLRLAKADFAQGLAETFRVLGLEDFLPGTVGLAA